jgi:hypothetical protein
VWLTVSLVPEKVVIGTGIRLLFFGLVGVCLESANPGRVGSRFYGDALRLL